MKLKKVISICLVGAMAATLLAGCSDSSSSDESTTEDEAEEVVEEADSAEEEEVEEAEEALDEDVEEEAEEAEEEEEAGGSSFEGFDETITITGYGFSMIADGLPEIVEAINEISIPAINVEVDYQQLDFGTYSEQLGLMLAGGEAFDFVLSESIVTSTEGFADMRAKNQLMDISDLVYEYAPETMELLGDYVEPFWADGALYALPAYRIFTADCYIIMRKDILDYLDLTEQAEAISSWSDFEAIMETVYEAQDELPEELQTPAMVNGEATGMVIPFGGYDNAADDFSEHYGFDYLGDSNRLIKVEDDGTVTCWYESEDYQEIISRVRDWYEKDWVYKDAATDIESGDSALLDGIAFASIQHSEVGIEASKKKSTGYDVVCVSCCSQPMQSSDVIGLAYGVPVTSKEPEAAVAFLNLMYTDPEIENLFVWGIEGRDYDLNDEGEALIRDDTLYQSADYLYANQFNAYPSEGEGGDFREYSLEVVNSTELSPYFGFSADLEPIENANSALNAVVQQYAPGLNSGTVDASETYDEFISALYNAGLQELIDYYQESLDAWLAGK